VRELTLRHEFLKAGDPADQLEASLSEMLVKELLIEWGLVEITGLTMDGQTVKADAVVKDAPEALALEIAAAVQREIGLSEDERKNF